MATKKTVLKSETPTLEVSPSDPRAALQKFLYRITPTTDNEKNIKFVAELFGIDPADIPTMKPGSVGLPEWSEAVNQIGRLMGIAPDSLEGRYSASKLRGIEKMLQVRNVLAAHLGSVDSGKAARSAYEALMQLGTDMHQIPTGADAATRPIDELDEAYASSARKAAKIFVDRNDSRLLDEGATPQMRLNAAMNLTEKVYPSGSEARSIAAAKKFLRERRLDDRTAERVLMDVLEQGYGISDSPDVKMRMPPHPNRALLESLAANSPEFAKIRASDQHAASGYLLDFAHQKSAEIGKLTDPAAIRASILAASKQAVTEVRARFPSADLSNLPKIVAHTARNGYDPAFMKKFNFGGAIPEPGMLRSAVDSVTRGLMAAKGGARQMMSLRRMGVAAVASFVAAGIYKTWKNAHEGKPFEGLSAGVSGLGDAMGALGDAAKFALRGSPKQEAPVAKEPPRQPTAAEEEESLLRSGSPVFGQLMQAKALAAENAAKLGQMEGSAQGSALAQAVTEQNLSRLSDSEIPVAMAKIYGNIQAQQQQQIGPQGANAQMEEYRRAMGGQ